MDVITQGILGAAVNQARYEPRLGKKAVYWNENYILMSNTERLDYEMYKTNPYYKISNDIYSIAPLPQGSQ